VVARRGAARRGAARSRAEGKRAGKGGRSRIYLQRATQSAGAKFRVRFCSAAHRRSSRGFPPYPSAHTSWPITRRSLRGPRTDLSSSSDHHPPAIRRSARVPRRVVPHRRGDVPWRESPLPIHVARHEEQEGIATSRRDACGAYRRTYPSIGRTVVARSRSQFDDGRERWSLPARVTVACGVRADERPLGWGRSWEDAASYKNTRETRKDGREKETRKVETIKGGKKRNNWER